MNMHRRGRTPTRPVSLPDPFKRDEGEDDLRQGASVHGSRDQEIPSDEPIHDGFGDDDWTPPALLEAPAPRPGFVQRWVRVRRGAQDDVKNWMRARRDGWTPRDPKTVPGGWVAPTDAHGVFGNCIMVEGMILCEMPERRNAKRKAYFAHKNGVQMAAVEHELLKIQQPGAPIHRSHQSTVTRGRKPNVQADEDAA